MDIGPRPLLAAQPDQAPATQTGDLRKAERSLGDPAAKVTVQEFFSLTCTHCAAFAQETMPEVEKELIAPGKVRFVYHDFPLDQVALTAAMVARYLPPAQVLPVRQALFASQDRWAFARGVNTTDELWKLAALAGMSRATFDQAIADTDLRNWILQQQQADQDRWKIELNSELCDQWPEVRGRNELRRVPQAAAGGVAERLAGAVASLLDLGANMAIPRRTLLSVVLASPALADPADAVRAERSLGSPEARLSSIECFSLTCPHCADFALKSLPELKAKWIASGRLRWVFYDFPTDVAALQAAMVARYLPPEQYEPFIDTLFAQQDHWVFGAGSVPDALWPLAKDAGMARPTFDRALADDGLRDWIVGRALDAQTRWHVDATPSFVINGKLYTGAMSASEFATILAS